MAHRNVQRLSERNSVVLQADTPAFHAGFLEGQTCTRNLTPLLMYEHNITETDIVAIVRNLTEVAQEGWLTEEHLRHDCGVIAGWLLRPREG